MRRRNFIKGIVGSAAAWPLAARAQQPVPVIGLMSSASKAAEAHLLQGFLRGLSQAGFIEGQNFRIEYRWAEDHFERLPAMAADLVRREVALIVTLVGTVTVLSAKAATTKIPILFVVGGDPVKSGLVASLNRPGGNITGINLLAGELDPKRLELLHEMVPKAVNIAVLRNPNNPNTDPRIDRLQSAARIKGLRINVLNAGNAGELNSVFEQIVQKKFEGLIVGTDPFLNYQVDKLVEWAARNKVPAIYGYREFTLAGGLMSYGPSAVEARRLLGLYAARILKGDKPADLPVMQSTKFDLVINLKTAKALGLTVPNTLLVSATEVID